MTRRVLRVIYLAVHPLPDAHDVVQIGLSVAMTAGLGGLVGWIGSWASGVVAAALSSAGLLFLAALRLQGEVDDFQARPRPNLVLDGFKYVPTQLQTATEIQADQGFVRAEQKIGLSEFACVRFTNEPAKRGEGADALDVHARITFFTEDEAYERLEVRDGKWEENADPTQATPVPPKTLARLPSSGASAVLAIATRWPSDKYWFGWSFEGGRTEGIWPGVYQVRVVLGVSNPDSRDREFWFTLDTTGKKMDLRERANCRNPSSADWARRKEQGIVVFPDPVEIRATTYPPSVTVEPPPYSREAKASGLWERLRNAVRGVRG